jgi:hypothetical protein
MVISAVNKASRIEERKRGNRSFISSPSSCYLHLVTMDRADMGSGWGIFRDAQIVVRQT